MKKCARSDRNRPFFSCLASSLSVLLGLSLFLASPQIGRARADTVSGDEAFIVIQDEDGKRWSELDGLNVFANGQLDGEHIVAPGSEGTYSFTVQNIGGFPLNYRISFGEDNEYGVPLEFRLKGKDGYLSEDWTSASGLAAIEEELADGAKAGYTLEWRWVFDGDDEHDTELGNKAAEGEVPYILKIHYSAEQIETDPPGPVETDPPGPVETDPPDPVETDPPGPVETDPPGSVETDPPVTDENDPPVTDENDPPVTDENDPPVTDENDPPVSGETGSTPPDGTEPPQTGDNGSLPLLISLAVCSGTALLLTAHLRRRDDDENK